MRNLENRLSALEKQLKPEGRHFYVWKDSATHKEAEEQYKPGDVIHIIGWLERDNHASCTIVVPSPAASVTEV